MTSHSKNTYPTKQGWTLHNWFQTSPRAKKKIISETNSMKTSAGLILMRGFFSTAYKYFWHSLVLLNSQRNKFIEEHQDQFRLVLVPSFFWLAEFPMDRNSFTKLLFHIRQSQSRTSSFPVKSSSWRWFLPAIAKKVQTHTK